VIDCRLFSWFRFSRPSTSGGDGVITLDPVANVNTRRDISDISWSYLNPDIIVVAFAHQPMLHVYDLNEPGEAVLVSGYLVNDHNFTSTITLAD
jgi:hypothetical protein